MESNDIDKLLKTVLSPTEDPSHQLNHKILSQLKEKREMRIQNKKLIFAACAVAFLLVIPTSVYAAYQYLSPKEAAKVMEDNKLGEAFEKDGNEVLQTVTDGIYKVTFLGHVTGTSISERTGSAWELHPERTYVAAAIERTDGTDMTYENSLFISPLIQGLQPWNYNIATMNGSYMGKLIDGVLYRIIECDNIEIFADRELYLAVSDTTFYSVEAFDYDEETGNITVNEAYNGTNILFNLELDPSKADQEKADEYIKQLEKEWNPNSDSEGTADSVNIGTDVTIDDINSNPQQIILTDTEKE